jgi:hypothetical protein
VPAGYQKGSRRCAPWKDGGALPVHQFSVEELQDASVLLPDGGRMAGSSYINNFIFFPQHMDGESLLSCWAAGLKISMG